MASSSSKTPPATLAAAIIVLLQTAGFAILGVAVLGFFWILAHGIDSPNPDYPSARFFLLELLLLVALLTLLGILLAIGILSGVTMARRLAILLEALFAGWIAFELAAQVMDQRHLPSPASAVTALLLLAFPVAVVILLVLPSSTYATRRDSGSGVMAD